MTVGGELDSEQRIRNYFNGIIAGKCYSSSNYLAYFFLSIYIYIYIVMLTIYYMLFITYRCVFEWVPRDRSRSER